MNDTLPIYETFHAWQGEGCHLGRSAFFIRTQGCPVHCPWCDSAGTWHPDYAPEKITRMSISELVERAQAAKPEFVVITGGEPAIHDLNPLTTALTSVGLPSHLETSGAYELRGAFAWITVSPKWWKLPLPENVQRANELKIIVEDETSIERWLAQLGPLPPERPVWLHPEWSQRANSRVLDAISTTVKQRGAPFRAGWQVHRLYNVDALDADSRPPVPLGGDPTRELRSASGCSRSAKALAPTSPQTFIPRMEHRFLGGSGLRVPVLTLGTATFGGGRGFSAWGNIGVPEATRLVDICLEAGLTMFDTADGYSDGAAEEILGAAIKGRRDRVLISTKGTFRTGTGPNDVGSSRQHLTQTFEASLRRLGTDYVDLYQLHGFDAFTPIEEVLQTLDGFVRAGKIRYLGCSNFSGWHLMKSLAIAEKYGLTRYVAHQAYYSLLGREYEWELMPLALDQKIGTVAWSPLGMGRLGGKVRRGQPLPPVSRLHDRGTVNIAPPAPDELVYRIVDALDIVAQETGKSVAQVAINWVLQRPTVSTVIIGARDEMQLRQNLDATGWSLDAAQIARLDAASEKTKTYPYWHQAQFAERNPFPTA